MAERKITVRNVSISLHVARIPIGGDEGAVRSSEIASVRADELSHTIMRALAKEGFKFPDMKYEVVK